MKNIIEKSRELTNQELYLLTMSPKSDSVKNHVGEHIDVSAWLLFEDTDRKTGEVHRVLSILTPENEVLSTISPTFQKDFMDMAELFNNNFAFEIISGKSKAGREFITCAFVNFGYVLNL